jgi:hypothetical protein
MSLCRRIAKLRLAFFLFFLLSSCTSFHGGEVIRNVEQSLIDIQKAIEVHLPLGKRMTSTNGREFFSNYFTVTDGRMQNGDRAPERFYAQVFVLGEERPYNIEVVVHRERRRARGGEVSLDYYEIATDTNLARVLARRIQLTLSKRRDDRNIIDDFRVF